MSVTDVESRASGEDLQLQREEKIFLRNISKWYVKGMLQIVHSYPDIQFWIPSNPSISSFVFKRLYWSLLSRVPASTNNDNSINDDVLVLVFSVYEDG